MTIPVPPSPTPSHSPPVPPSVPSSVQPDLEIAEVPHIVRTTGEVVTITNTSISAAEGTEQAILSKGIPLKNIINIASSTKELQSFTNKGLDYFKGVVSRTITYTDPDDPKSTKTLIIQQEIFTSIPLPDRLHFDQRTCEEYKMRALFTIGAHEDVVKIALDPVKKEDPANAEIVASAKQLAIACAFDRDPLSKGFYGGTYWAGTNSESLFQQLTHNQGSITGTTVARKTVGLTKENWNMLLKIKCPTLDQALKDFNEFQDAVADITKKPIESLSQNDKKYIRQYDTNSVLMTLEREIANDIDIFNAGAKKEALQEALQDLKTAEKHLDHSRNNVVAGTKPDVIAANQKKLERDVAEAREKCDQLLMEPTFQRLQKRLDILHYLLNNPSEFPIEEPVGKEKHNSKIHQKNSAYLDKLHKGVVEHYNDLQSLFLKEFPLEQSRNGIKAKPAVPPSPQQQVQQQLLQPPSVPLSPPPPPAPSTPPVPPSPPSQDNLEIPKPSIKSATTPKRATSTPASTPASTPIPEGYTHFRIPGDHNCLFNAYLGAIHDGGQITHDQMMDLRKRTRNKTAEFLKDPIKHPTLRHLILSTIREYNNTSWISEKNKIPFMDDGIKDHEDRAIDDYVSRIEKDLFWGSPVELYVLSIADEVNIKVIASRSKQFDEAIPINSARKKTIYLEFTGSHYNAYIQSKKK